MDVTKRMKIFFYLILISMVGAFYTWSATTKNLPQAFAFDYSWIDWIWMCIPIFCVYYSYKHKDNLLAKRNIIVGIIVIILLFFGGLFSFVLTYKASYSEVFKYEKVLQVELPKDVSLIKEQTSDLDEKISNLTEMTIYYNKNIDITVLDKQVKNSHVWKPMSKVNNTEIIKVLPSYVKINNFDDLYYLVYDKDSQKYNASLQEKGEVNYIAAVYNKRLRTISIYTYSYNSK